MNATGSIKTSRFSKLLVLLAAALLPVAPAQAAFQVPLSSVRAASMGSASMAAADEAAALFINPAGLALMNGSEAAFMYNRMYAGLPGVGNIGTGYMAFGMPTQLGTFGLGVGSFQASDLKQERTIAVSYARKVGKIRLGLTGKHLSQNYLIGSDLRAGRDPVFSNGTSRSAVSVDAGIIASIRGPFRVGVAVRNLNEPNVGLVTKDTVKREIQGGAFLDFASLNLKTSADMFIRSDGIGGRQYLPALGMEKGIGSTGMSMRSGISTTEFTAGVGIKVGQMSFDYGLVMNFNLLSDNMGSHRVGMSYHFGCDDDKKDNRTMPSRKLSADDDLWQNGFFEVR